ncbi:MAG: two-component sensor histidine kinase [Clostridia bacterium]|nr:two-component sensor histidine kinase [Clostridia bacterium]
MKRKVFKCVFRTAMVFFLLCCLLFVLAFYRYSVKAYAAQLREEALCAAAALEAAGDSVLPDIGGMLTARVTWIAADGQVLYDSSGEADRMENHADREEVQEALLNGTGEGRRFSASTGETMVYAAVRLTDGTVLRVAAPPYGGAALLFNLFTPLLVALLLAGVLAGLLAMQVSRSVLRPIEELELSGTDERDVYPELRPLVRRINTQNRQIYRQMEGLKAEHERQDTLRREFTANVSHELKTPLTTISGSAELLRDGLVRPEDVPVFGGRIYDESQRLMTLVGDIIKLSRLESRLEMPDKHMVDLYELCDMILSHLEPVAKKQAVSLSLMGQPMSVFGAESTLYEMVYNLCDNAIKYNRPGGSVTVTLEQKDGRVCLTVADTGIGIPPEDVERIFERFYRVDKSHSRDVGGTGLGLSIVKHGASYHGVEVSVDSTVGEGTAMHLLFPPAVQRQEI